LPTTASLTGSAGGIAVTVTYDPSDRSEAVMIAYEFGGAPITRELQLAEARDLYRALSDRMLAGETIGEWVDSFQQSTTNDNDQHIWPIVERLAFIDGVVPAPCGLVPGGGRAVREAFASANGWTLAKTDVDELGYSYIDTGAATATAGTVVLLPGYPDSWYEWRTTIPFLVEHGYRVVSIDLPGTGDSDAAAEVARYKAVSIADDVDALLTDVLGVPRYNLVGHDWGAAPAWMGGIHHPESVARLVTTIVGHPAVYLEDIALFTAVDARKFSYFGFMTSETDAPDDMALRRDARFFRMLARGNADVDTYLPDLRRPGALRSARQLYVANVPDIFSTWPATPACTVPTMGIVTLGDGGDGRNGSVAGDASYTNPVVVLDSGRHVTASYTSLSMRSHPTDPTKQATHWPQLDHAEEFNTRLLAFLQDQPQPVTELTDVAVDPAD
jgi:pimeloyl-ACP methyl ester carboxylesterase